MERLEKGIERECKREQAEKKQTQIKETRRVNEKRTGDRESIDSL